MNKRILFTVTSDLSYDQRMNRICTSLANAGYTVTLVGRTLRSSIPLTGQPFKQKRINCFFDKGKLFYAEYNIRLFFFLLPKKMDCLVAIDLDTILPVYFISRLKNKKRVYDAHELFCEMKEIVTRPSIYNIWKKIEQFAVPKFTMGYTVNQPIADEFKKMYAVNFEVIRNIPWLKTLMPFEKKEKFILYQGAVNEGRSFETLIPAFKDIDGRLIICGDGNFLLQAKQLVALHHLQDKIVFKGKLKPDELSLFTQQAYIGITLFENTGLSNYLSLGNRFFDYLHAGIPQLCVDYPVYAAINHQLPIALLVTDISATNLAAQLNHLLTNDVLYHELQQNCLCVRQTLNWQNEEKKLIAFYNHIFD